MTYNTLALQAVRCNQMTTVVLVRNYTCVTDLDQFGREDLELLGANLVGDIAKSSFACALISLP
ncbi:hypothetical protein A1F94_003053 [Pyrenophora tritici-repentis]|nr:hypothetical protein PtrV1_04265 [Pyrenophora tritici-repentis]KAF7451946.1 hypothetical protein A1F99_037230 [Pyrenophora tritici-repentis]KAG9386303.1 hypothetical protein A1F94_003053 [Pyrenophora tritici-repentis]KAI1607365.1 hypothetical protein PtrCC142_000453 [Pyrenophora tritici-repentis]PZD36564.1 hypothetical protein A1F96_00088 [Pyrenophora tritici-repentis]